MSLLARATWSWRRPARQGSGCWARPRPPKRPSPKSNAVPSSRRFGSSGRRGGRSSRPAIPRWRDRSVKARGATRQFAARVPPVRRVARVGRQRLVGARHQAMAVQHRIRRRLGQLRSTARTRHGSVEANLEASPATGLWVVADRVVVDVDHSARHDLHTGIQQVVRRSLPFWAREYPVLAAAWTAGWCGLRPLSEAEQRRVLHWGDRRRPRPRRPRRHRPAPALPRLPTGPARRWWWCRGARSWC